jgi:fluoroacetyl-CoA thioesterase
MKRRAKTAPRKNAKKTPAHSSRPRKNSPQSGAGVEYFRPKIGSEITIEALVPHDWTIQAFDQRLPAVLSTPAMIKLMEHATTRAVLPQLPPGAISVGTRIEVDHLKAVPDGATVQAYARLIGFKGRFLIFKVEARSGEIVIGRGRVFRAIVDTTKHGDKAKARVAEEADAAQSPRKGKAPAAVDTASLKTF